MNNTLSKLLLAAKSRTVWTAIIIFLINGIDGVKDLIPVDYLPFVNGILTVLVAYFRVNPTAGSRKSK